MSTVPTLTHVAPALTVSYYQNRPRSLVLDGQTVSASLAYDGHRIQQGSVRTQCVWRDLNPHARKGTWF
jgi:hypothetical protein